MKTEELKKLIITLVNKIDDERALRALYRLANELYCRR